MLSGQNGSGSGGGRGVSTRLPVDWTLQLLLPPAQVAVDELACGGAPPERARAVADAARAGSPAVVLARIVGQSCKPAPCCEREPAAEEMLVTRGRAGGAESTSIGTVDVGAFWEDGWEGGWEDGRDLRLRAGRSAPCTSREGWRGWVEGGGTSDVRLGEGGRRFSPSFCCSLRRCLAVVIVAGYGVDGRGASPGSARP